ncbi:hypothetical protein [Herbiconiux ginsengi]|uniref:Uncharacterized protein n=1 Tax=Herbiconiux ginsengi TaxID=381665 RepID=A0A1H3JW23_9MICO|nr:hypothetical protein [Herbiconiux ginsengi]SDY44081.1 hypothetical protein SAMN05216554_0330 [Herbiconiux ginsengi]
MPSAVVDTEPLSARPTPAELRAYRRGRGAVHGPRVRVRPCLGGLSYTTLLVVSGLTTGLLVSLGADPRAVVLGCLLMVGSAVGAFLCARATSIRTYLREYRLAAFAARNGLVYERGATTPSVPGLQYSDGAGRALRRFSGVIAGLPVEAGNYRHPAGEISGYVIAGGRFEIVAPFDFADPAEWERAWHLISR